MCKDYQAQSAFDVRFGESTAIDLPKSNVLQFVTEDGGVVSARPSGTEPKIKFYCSVNAPLDSAKRYRDVARELDTRIDRMLGDLGVGWGVHLAATNTSLPRTYAPVIFDA